MTNIIVSRKMEFFFWVTIAVALFLLLPTPASATTVGNNVTVTSKLTVSGSASTTNATTSGYLEVGNVAGETNAAYSNGALNVGGTSFMRGAVTLDGGITIGDATSDTITINSRFASDLDPSTNNARDIGAYGLAYKDFYASGTVYLNNVSTTAGIYPQTTNAYDLGGFGAAWNEIYTSGTVFLAGVSSTSGLYPTANNSYDIGEFARAWNNLFTSGTIYIAGVSSTAGLYPTANNSYDLGGYTGAWKDIYASGTLFVGSLTTLGSSLSIDGNATLGNATSSDIVYLNARLASALIPTANNSEDMGEFARAWNDIFASGTASLGVVTTDGNMTIGSSTANTLTVNARLAADLDPSTNNARDFGAFSLAYKDLYSSGTAFLGVVTTDGNMTIGSTTSHTITLNARFASNLVPSTNNTRDLGIFGNAFNEIYASGTAFLAGVSSTSGLYPTANSSYDLGGYSTAAWRDIYSSGTAYLGSVRIAGSSTIIPNVNNSIDLGGANSWRHIFASGTLFSYGVSTTDAVTSNGYMSVGKTDYNGLIGGLFSVGWGNGDLNVIGDLVVGLTSNFVGEATFRGGLNIGSTGIALNANNTLNLAAYGAAWKDLFASGTLYSVTSTVANAVDTSTIYVFSKASGQRGGHVVVEDSDGSGCTAIYGTNGTVVGTTVTCPESY